MSAGKWAAAYATAGVLLALAGALVGGLVLGALAVLALATKAVER